MCHTSLSNRVDSERYVNDSVNYYKVITCMYKDIRKVAALLRSLLTSLGLPTCGGFFPGFTGAKECLPTYLLDFVFRVDRIIPNTMESDANSTRLSTCLSGEVERVKMTALSFWIFLTAFKFTCQAA